MKGKQQSWAVDGESLRTRTRRGGRVALKGFEYQASHALHLISRLLFNEGGLIQLRYEGAQDIDTMYGDGRQVFIQCKDTPEKEYDFESVQGILHGFMCDTIDACGKPTDAQKLEHLQLEFVLVSSGVITGTEMLRLIRGSLSDTLAKLLAKDFSYAANPVAKHSDTLKFAKYVIQHTSVRLSPQLEGQQHEQETLAFARLAMFGVPTSRIQASLDGLRGLLTPPRSLFAADAARSLVGLPEYHPASGRSPISFLPSESAFHHISSVEREFRDSGRVSWAAIHYGLDAQRDCYKSIHDELVAMERKSALVLVTGNSAAGKSTLVRRVAWDIHRAGKTLVFEVIEPQKLNMEAWNEVIRLGEIACKPVIIVCDELDAESPILEQVRLQPHAKVIVLTSARTENVIPSSFPVHIYPYRLQSVSEQELNNLAGDIGLNSPRTTKFSTLMRSGDMFALSLSLRGSSLEKVAIRTLERVKQLFPYLHSVFLCLCACGVRDQGVPKRLLMRMTENSEQWVHARDEGLVFFEVGDRFRSGHATLSDAILQRTGIGAIDLKMRLLAEVDINDPLERRFGLGLLKNGLAEQKTALGSFRTQITSFTDALTNDGDYLDLARGLEVINALIESGTPHLGHAQAKLIAAMGPDRVRTGYDAVRFMSHAEDYITAFPIVARVFAQPSVSFGRNTFMRWVIGKGAGHLSQQRDAIAINLQWLRNVGFPTSETIKLIDCIVNCNAVLPVETQAEFSGILRTVLDALQLPPQNEASLDLLYTICEAIEFRVRDKTLITTLLDRLERQYDATEIIANPKLLRRVVTAASLAGDDAGKKRTFQFFVSALPHLTPQRIFKVYLILLQLLPDIDKPAVLAWQSRIKNATPSTAAAIADEFIKGLPAHLTSASSLLVV